MSLTQDPRGVVESIGTPPPQQLTFPAPQAQRAALIYEGVSEAEDEELLRRMCDGDGFLPDVKSFELAFKYGNEVIVKISQAVAQGVVNAVAELTQDTRDCCADIYEKVADEIKSVGRETITTVEALALLLAQGSEEIATTISILQAEIAERLQQQPGTTYPPVPLPYEPIIPPIGPVLPGPYPGPVPAQPSPPRPTVPPGGPEPDERPVYPSPATVPPALPVGFTDKFPAEVCEVPLAGSPVPGVWPIRGEVAKSEFAGGVPIQEGFPGRQPTVAEILLSPLYERQSRYIMSILPPPAGAPCDYLDADPAQVFAAATGDYYKRIMNVMV